MADSVLASRSLNQENVAPLGDAKTRLKDSAVGRRPALGTITNNGTRVQPNRAAKTKTSFTVFTDGDENAAPPARPPPARSGAASAAPQPLRSFQIHEDKENEPARAAPSKGLSLRAADAVLSSFDGSGVLCGAKGGAGGAKAASAIPRVFQLTDDASLFDKESPMKIDSSLLQLERSLPDIDDPESSDDPVFDCPEYAADIYEYLVQFECKTRPKPKYMLKQPDINMNMRAILVDWLVEVSEEYKLHDETLFLAVNYIDRFLSQMSVQRGKLQLVGTAAMFIASKFEEIYPPELSEFVYITDDTYSKKQVLRMEHLILKVLDFDMATPTRGVFLRRFNKWSTADEITDSLSKFLAELTLVDGDPFLQYGPSLVAAASVCLARHTLGHEAWPDTLATKTGFALDDLEDCLKDIHKAFLTAGTHQQQAVREKYANAKHHQVSTLNPPTSLPFC